MIPKDIRHTDISRLRLRGPDEMTKLELIQFNEMKELATQQEDVQTNNPYLKDFEDDMKEQLRILEPDRLKAIEFVETRKNKKDIAKVKQVIKEAKEEGWILK